MLTGDISPGASSDVGRWLSAFCELDLRGPASDGVRFKLNPVLESLI